MNIIVTGGAGFIGSNFIFHMLKKYPDYRIVCLDCLTYAGNLSTLAPVMDNPNFRFVKENMEVKVLSYKGNVFGVEPPFFVELEVTETDPGFKGDTATNATKPATLETGAEIRVPLFINQGDMIRVDTRTGEYMERA